jgi:hypothetical protein
VNDGAVRRADAGLDEPATAGDGSAGGAVDPGVVVGGGPGSGPGSGSTGHGVTCGLSDSTTQLVAVDTTPPGTNAVSSRR